MRAQTVAVIGAGWSGCAAAVELAEAGCRITVFESAKEAGGRAKRVHTKHGPLDNGQHILAGAYAQTLALMARVGADPDKLLLRLPLELQFPGKLSLRAPRLPAPLHTAAALLGARGLSWSEKFSAFRLMASLKRSRFRLDRDRTVADLLTEQSQPLRLVRLLWEPLCIATINTPIDQASAQVFASVLRDTLGADAHASDLLLPRVDLSALFPEPALSWLAARGHCIKFSTPVRALSPSADSGWLLEGDDWRADFDAVILATGPVQAQRLLPELRETLACREALAGLNFEPILTCYLGYSTPIPLPFPMIGLEGGLGQWVFRRDSLLKDSPSPTLAVVVSAAGKLRNLPDADLALALHREIEAVLGPLPPLLWHQVITEQRATFACTPNLRRPGTDSGMPGLLLCGDFVASDYPATLEGAVRSGILAAKYIIER